MPHKNSVFSPAPNNRDGLIVGYITLIEATRQTYPIIIIIIVVVIVLLLLIIIIMLLSYLVNLYGMVRVPVALSEAETPGRAPAHREAVVIPRAHATGVRGAPTGIKWRKQAEKTPTSSQRRE